MSYQDVSIIIVLESWNSLHNHYCNKNYFYRYYRDIICVYDFWILICVLAMRACSRVPHSRLLTATRTFTESRYCRLICYFYYIMQHFYSAGSRGHRISQIWSGEQQGRIQVVRIQWKLVPNYNNYAQVCEATYGGEGRQLEGGHCSAGSAGMFTCPPWLISSNLQCYILYLEWLQDR